MFLNQSVEEWRVDRVMRHAQEIRLGKIVNGRLLNQLEQLVGHDVREYLSASGPQRNAVNWDSEHLKPGARTLQSEVN